MRVEAISALRLDAATSPRGAACCAAAMPVGGPVCEYQALVAPADQAFDQREAALALSVGRIDSTAGLSDSAIGVCLHPSEVGHVARFPEGWDAWCADRQAAGSKVVARARRGLARFRRDLNCALLACSRAKRSRSSLAAFPLLKNLYSCARTL